MPGPVACAAKESGLDPSALRRMVHEKLQRGLLPATAPLHETRLTEPARTAPRSCTACEEPLVPGQTVHELRTGTLRLRLHAGCHAVWRAARAALLSEALGQTNALDTAWGPHAANEIGYVIDADDRLVACGRESWRRFALANDGADLADPDPLLGRSLFDFVRGDGVRQLYGRIHRRLLFGNETRRRRLWSRKRRQLAEMSAEARQRLDAILRLELLELSLSLGEYEEALYHAHALDEILPTGETHAHTLFRQAHIIAEKQLRLALGQVLRYRQLLQRRGERVTAMIAVERLPSDRLWLELCGELGVMLVVPDEVATELGRLT